jgi:c-di-GMP-binding flagellar brake protein YcgR
MPIALILFYMIVRSNFQSLIEKDTIVGAEQRKSPRRQLSATIKVTLPDQTIINAIGIDISATGIGFIIRNLIKIGQTCHVDFNLVIYSQKVRIYSEAIIAHSSFIGIQGYRTGVQFQDISPENSEQISIFMR